VFDKNAKIFVNAVNLEPHGTVDMTNTKCKSYMMNPVTSRTLTQIEVFYNTQRIHGLMLSYADGK
jgi:hypothetical protein